MPAVRLDAETAAFTALALVAFASNSILTRLALGSREIDAATFTTIRLVSGAVALALVVRVNAGSWSSLRASGPVGPLALIAYAAPFSFAYLRIGAAVGALVLFATVQLTMVLYGVAGGERPRPIAWGGLLMATVGLVALTAGSSARPDPSGLLLMALAGVAWGAYSIAGRMTPDPLAANARSFIWSSPLALLLSLTMRGSSVATPRGVTIALVSGIVTSAFGYAIWYRALRRLAVTQAAVAQLSVPVLAALGAVIFLGEALSQRLIFSGAAVVGGIALVVASRPRAPQR